MVFFKILLFLSVLPFSLCQEFFDPSSAFPRPLIIEYAEINDAQSRDCQSIEVQLKCTSWRVAVEANNLSPWTKIPEDCADYVKEYMVGKGYELDLQRVSSESENYARSVSLSGDGKDAWIFDIDETLLSNLPYYAEHGYGLEIFDSSKFDQWVEMGTAPAVESSLKIYDVVLSLGIKAFLLTGRSERHRNITVHNLLKAGFQDWNKLILRSSEDHGKTATQYKSEKRDELIEDGYRILGNSGDQWSDLLGSSTSNRSFKLPNPMYHIP
ncbi:acid phosphatase 1-like [Primulina eburnea]|uniref:acid phosphatase 1-like n=1 Tax=Primulina eburnea TaxID=1245227 RepID=UPI003C6C6918